MQHFFVEPEQVKGNHIYIKGADVNHIKNVLRMKIGELLELNDGRGKKYIGEIMSFGEETISIVIQEELEMNTELPSKIFLFQGLPKSDKMELIIQKAVELGVFEIIPVITKRTVVKLDDKKKGKKVERWNSISESAAKQSARGIIPNVKNVMSLKEAFHYAQSINHKMIPYELADRMDVTRQAIDQVKTGESVAIFIGPEGGFEANEIEEALEEGITPITLGKRILRTETAGLATLAILMFQLEGK